jgi:hypothetical protein
MVTSTTEWDYGSHLERDMEDAVWAIAVVLAVLVLVELRRNGIFKDLVYNRGRLGNVLDKQTELLQQQNLRLENIAAKGISYGPGPYIPPTVPFCDLCRKEFPESNHWWTVYHEPGYVSPFKLCAYPQQKEKPDDKWLHGEECVVAELRTYLENVQRVWNKWLGEGVTGLEQRREYTEKGESGNEGTKMILVVSSCNHCGKEYSESDFWWTLSRPRGGIEIEIEQGFKLYPVFEQADHYYFCQKECVVGAVRVFVGTQLRALPPEAWEHYDDARAKSVRHSTPRRETPGCEDV